MKEVSIYTATSIRGRWEKDGHIGYVLEYYAEGSKYPKTLIDYEQVSGLNENRAELEALIRAITRMREKCVLTIYTESDYLYQGLAEPGYAEEWIKNGWRTRKGTEVKNRDKWQKLMELLHGNLYTLQLKANNAYTGGLIAEMRRKER